LILAGSIKGWEGRIFKTLWLLGPNGRNGCWRPAGGAVPMTPAFRACAS